MSDLACTLADAFQPRPPSPEVRALRERLCTFIRVHEARVFDVGHPRAPEVRTLLGWDDETMTTFTESSLLCQSSPHAAMNLFPPTLAFPWILGSAVRLAEQRHKMPAIHVRTACTHHDFDDTFAKPHAWWHRTADGEVVKTHLFTRQPIKYHPMLSKAPPTIETDSLHYTDRDAIELARLGTNYGYFCVIYRAYLERLAGFHQPHRLIEAPIDLLNRFTIAETGLLAWYDALADAGLRLRLEVADAPLAELTRESAAELARTAEPWPARAVIAPNPVNFAQFYRLGLSFMLGARAMAAYVPDMNVKITKLVTPWPGWACEPPAFLPFTRVPFVTLLGLDDEAARCERAWGISTSLPLIVSALGREVSARLAPMLAMDYGELFDPAAVASG